MERKKQVAALPVRQDASGKLLVLLVTSRETRRLVIPKGWPWPGVKDHKAAAEEAREEAGILGKIAKKPLGSYTYDKRLVKGDVPVKASKPANMLVGVKFMVGILALKAAAAGFRAAVRVVRTVLARRLLRAATAGLAVLETRLATRFVRRAVVARLAVLAVLVVSVTTCLAVSASALATLADASTAASA